MALERAVMYRATATVALTAGLWVTYPCWTAADPVGCPVAAVNTVDGVIEAHAAFGQTCLQGAVETGGWPVRFVALADRDQSCNQTLSAPVKRPRLPPLWNLDPTEG